MINFSISFFNPSFSWVQMKKIPSMYLSHNNGCNSFVSKKTLLHPIHANACIIRSELITYSGSWYLLKELVIKLKQVIFKTNSAILIRLSVGIFFTEVFSRTSLSALKYAWCRILGYKPTTSVVTSNVFSGRVPVFLIFYRKCPKSLMYDLPLCMIGLNW